MFSYLPFSLFFMIISPCFSQTVTFDSSWSSGVSTSYSTINNGHCSYGSIATSSFPYGYIAALSSISYSNSAACGSCYEVKCVSTSNTDCNGCNLGSDTVTIQVTDECPSCSESTNHIDLSEAAFSAIADLTCGEININFRRVSCDYPSSSNIIIRNKDGINGWWYALFIENVANYGEIASVELKEYDGTSWILGTKTAYNAFVFTSTSSNGIKTPLSLRVTDGLGTVLTSYDIVTSLEPEKEFDFKQNFDISATATDSGNGASTDSETDATTSDIAADTGSDIVIQNKDGINNWWYALYLLNVASGCDIKSVALKDSNLNYYTTGELDTWNFYKFQSNEANGWQLPYSIKITESNGNVLEHVDIITSNEPDITFDFGFNFDSCSSSSSSSDSASSSSALGASVSYRKSSSDSESININENESEKKESFVTNISLFEWILFVFGCFVFGLICCLGFGCHWIKKSNGNSENLKNSSQLSRVRTYTISNSNNTGSDAVELRYEPESV